MSDIVYTQEVFNLVNDTIKYNEAYIKEIYASYAMFTQDEKKKALELINSLKMLNHEYEKYCIVYNQLYANDVKTQNEYVVIQGDTLPRVANKVFGDFSRWQEIYRHNNLSDIHLTPGDILRIPE